MDKLFHGSEPDAGPICNLDAERVVIGACLRSDIGRAVCVAALKPEDFYAAAHIDIFRVIGELDKAGPVYLVALVDALNARGVNGGGRSYLEECTDQCTTPDAPQWAVNLVKEKAQRRRLVRTLGEAKTIAQDETLPMDEAQARTEGMILGMREADKEEFDPEEWAQRVAEEAARVEQGEEGRRRIKTGIVEIDANVNLWPGCLTVLSGGTSQGKTAVALATAANAAFRLQQRVYLWSGEMPNDELMDRLSASELGLMYEAVQRRRLTPEQRKAVAQFSSKVKRSTLIMRDKPRSVAEIRAECRYLSQRKGPIDLVVIDYLTLLKELNLEADGADRRDTRVGKAVWELIQMARELQCHVLLLHQLNREKDRRATGRPKISDLRESGQIEHHSHNVLLVYRPDRDEALTDEERAPFVGWLELIVGKARGGRVGSLFLGFDGDKQRVTDRSGPRPKKPEPMPLPGRGQRGRRKGNISD